MNHTLQDKQEGCFEVLVLRRQKHDLHTLWDEMEAASATANYLNADSFVAFWG